MDYYDHLRDKASQLGADLFGVTDTERLRKYIDSEIKEASEGLLYTVSIAVRLHRKVFDTLTTGPNVLYKHHYRTANAKLDRIILDLGNFIQNEGYSSLPIPASVYTDWDDQRAHYSHRHAALNAGLGFQGRNGLLVHPEYGAALRLACLLTDMPLHTDSPIEADCGKCRACIAACPVNAISILGPDKFDGRACFEQLREHARNRGIGVFICGLCIKACKGPNQGLG